MKQTIFIKFIILNLFLINSSVYSKKIIIPENYENIQQGIDASMNGDTIFVLEGIYEENLVINGKSIYLLGVSGASRTIIDGQNSNVIRCEYNSSKIIGFTISNGYIGISVHLRNQDSLVIQNNIIRENKTGILIESLDGQGAKIIGNWIENNSDGSGIQIYDTSAKIYNNILLNNNSERGGGIYCVSAVSTSYPQIINNTIIFNSASEGGGIYIGWDSHVTIMNNIISQNTQGGGIFKGPNGNPIISYNDVWNNSDSSYKHCIPGISDISDDPLFIGAKVFQLLENSPCINSGNPLEEYNDPDGSINDIGATGGPYSEEIITTGIESSIANLTYNSNLTLLQNYPNPFNPKTTIEFEIPYKTFVTLTIYNLLGEKITTLINKILDFGKYSVEFNAKSLSSGLYFYRLDTNKYTRTKKFIVSK